MNGSRKDELSLHMRLPAEKCYLANAILTLEGICDHFSVSDTSRSRALSALETALTGSIDLSYQDTPGLFDLKFSVFKDKLQITVEDFMLDENANQAKAEEQESIEQKLRDKLSSVVNLTDGFRLFRESGRNSCYSMQFNLIMVE